MQCEGCLLRSLLKQQYCSVKRRRSFGYGVRRGAGGAGADFGDERLIAACAACVTLYLAMFRSDGSKLPAAREKNLLTSHLLDSARRIGRVQKSRRPRFNIAVLDSVVSFARRIGRSAADPDELVVVI